MKKISVITALVAVMFASGCAHMINVTPPANTISPEGITKVDKTVGYYISKEQRALLVTSKGGGGDKVTYHPYAELEPTLNQVLSNVLHQGSRAGRDQRQGRTRKQANRVRIRAGYNHDIEILECLDVAADEFHRDYRLHGRERGRRQCLEQDDHGYRRCRIRGFQARLLARSPARQ